MVQKLKNPKKPGWVVFLKKTRVFSSPDGTGNLTTLNMRRAVLGESETQDLWWCSGAHLPDIGRPTCGSVRMMYAR